MVDIVLEPARRFDVDEFLVADFPGLRVELKNGGVLKMAACDEASARVSGNILSHLHRSLRGSGCRPYGPGFAMQTEERTIRFPDVSVYCDNPTVPENWGRQLLGDPQVIVEVLSPSTSSLDQRVKLAEYMALTGVREILLVDPKTEKVRLVARTAEGWSDTWLDAGSSVMLSSLAIDIPHEEIFAHD